MDCGWVRECSYFRRYTLECRVVGRTFALCTQMVLKNVCACVCNVYITYVDREERIGRNVNSW